MSRLLLVIGAGLETYKSSSVPFWREGEERDVTDPAVEKYLLETFPLQFKVVEASDEDEGEEGPAGLVLGRAADIVGLVERGAFDEEPGLDLLERAELAGRKRSTILEAVTSRRVLVKSNAARDQQERDAAYAFASRNGELQVSGADPVDLTRRAASTFPPPSDPLHRPETVDVEATGEVDVAAVREVAEAEVPAQAETGRVEVGDNPAALQPGDIGFSNVLPVDTRPDAQPKSTETPAPEVKTPADQRSSRRSNRS